MRDSDKAPQLNRRDFLRTAGITVAGVGLELGPWPAAWARGKGKVRLWSDPKTWRGRVPGPRSVAFVRGRVLLDRNASVREVHVLPGAELIFQRRRNRTLRVTGNVLVHGKLTMAPKRGRQHRLVFNGVREQIFVGGGMDALASDVGLWVMDGGVLNIAGSPKLAWTRAEGGIAQGATHIKLQQDPAGWQVGDSLVLTPTISPADQSFAGAYDNATIKAIHGRTVELADPVGFPHPAVEVKPGTVYGAEVLNMSRSVQIEGTPEGRSHVFVHSTRPQQIRYAALRYMGPQKAGASGNEFVAGRYGLHFHHCGDASRGSIVEGVTISQCGAHAFVPHMSNGITFRDCISHETATDAYWWDPPELEDSRTHDTLFERCVASRVLSTPDEGYRLTGFFLGLGVGNIARDCVAVGVGGWSNSSGFSWPEQSQGLWLFEGCVAHNNALDGIFAWQTNEMPHEIARFVGYHNGEAGISHGAYANHFGFRDSVLYGNLRAALILKAVSRRNKQIVLDNLYCDGAGISDYVVEDHQHRVPSDLTTRFSNCTFTGFKKSAVWMRATQSSSSWVDFVNCSYGGNEFWLDTTVPAATRVRVSDPVHGDLTLRPRTQPGVLRPEWNATVTSGWEPLG